MLTTELQISVLFFFHKDNQVIIGKSSWYRLSSLFEYYFIIVIIAFTIFPFSSHAILEYFFLPSSILSLSVYVQRMLLQIM